MTLRHGVLTVAALAVLGLGVYLFLEVRATPATANVPRPESVAITVPEEAPSAPRADTPTPSAVRSIQRIETLARPSERTSASPSVASAVPPEDLQKVDAIMSEANKAYDRGDFEDARQTAMRVLAIDPANTRMLRIVVSAACIDGDPSDAQKHYLMLPPGDRQQMKSRCARYGVTFNDS